MIVIYVLIAVFIAWIWVDYFRLIDIYDKENLIYFVATFLLGAASILLVFGIDDYLLKDVPLQLNGHLLNDILFCVFRVGLLEEFSKCLAFLIIWYVFKKQFNEPLDYLVYISIVALGFAAAENVLYFNNRGPNIIDGRAILSTVGHMFDTSLVAYGIILYKFYEPRKSILQIALFFGFAVLSHAFYDFWLMFEGTKSYGWILTILYFLVTISLYATILNNSLNQSALFSYKKLIDSNKISTRIFTYYGIIFLMQILLLTYLESFSYAIVHFCASFFLTGFIIIITVTRLSRFTLIQNRWYPLKLELPFSLGASSNGVAGPVGGGIWIQVKGEPSYQCELNKYLEDYVQLCPVSLRNSIMESTHEIFVERLVFLDNLDRYYLIRIFEDENRQNYELSLLKLKLSNYTLLNGRYQIFAVFQLDEEDKLNVDKLSIAELCFQEWAYVVPYDEEKTVGPDLSKLF